jgi:PEGA domain
MKRAISSSLVFAFLLAVQCFSQSGAVIPQGGAGHADQASCVILKRMGPADEVTSHLYSFGIRGKQFQYIEGKLPEGFPFHGRLTDHDVRNLQARGAEVVVVEPHYTAEDLKQARADCRGETGKTPNQSEAKAEPAQSPAGTAPAIAAAPSNSGSPQPVSFAAAVASATASTGRLSVLSVPDGADIEIDGSFVGNTPSEVQVAEGDHTVTVKKAGFKDWERKLKVSGGSNVHLNAELEKVSNP